MGQRCDTDKHGSSQIVSIPHCGYVQFIQYLYKPQFGVNLRHAGQDFCQV